MKKGWEIKKMGEVCYKGSSNVSQNQLTNDNGDFPIFGASGFIKNVSFYHNDKPYLSIVKDGSGVGRVTKMDAYTSAIGTLQYIFPKDGIDLNYLYYSLLTIDFKKYVAGAAIPHIYFKDYQNEPFLYVPLPEQHRIVSILNQCFAAIDNAKANAEQNLKNTRELFESYLQGVFENGKGWEVKRLKDIALVFGRGKSKHRPRNWEGLYGGDYPFIQTGEVRNANKYVLEYTQTYNDVGLPKLFKDEDELRKLWSNPQTRKILLEKLDEAGFPKSDLLTLQKLVDLEKSDLYDVLEYVFNGDYIAMTCEARAKAAEATIFAPLNDRQKEFISFVLNKYIEIGVDELEQEKLPFLLTNKYQSLEDAKEILGDAANISRLFIEFQEYLYMKKVA